MTKMLKEVGVVADKGDVKALVDKLKGKNLTTVINEGFGKFAALGGGGGGGAASAAPAGGAGGDAPAAEKKEEAKKVEEEEEEMDMGDFWGGGDDY